MHGDVLYLGSRSQGRQHLLKLARIPFYVIEHTSDEKMDSNGMPFAAYVLRVAQHKMSMLALPSRDQVGKDTLFVLTADTLVRNPLTDEVFGKPTDRANARHMLSVERQGPVHVVTGCCLEKYFYDGKQWEKSAFEHWTSEALVEFYVDEDTVDQYFELLPMALYSSGAGIVEDFGLSFVKSIQGSSTAVTGLPLYELRQALKKLCFIF